MQRNMHIARKGFIFAAIIGAMLCSVFVGAEARAQIAPAAAPGEVYMCSNTQIVDRPNRKFNEYWSDTFASDALQADIEDAWHKYLVAMYHMDPAAAAAYGCGKGPATHFTNYKRQARQSWEQNTRINQQRVAAGSRGPVEEHNVIETGWKYTGGVVTHAASQMPAEIRRMIDEEVPRGVRYVCEEGALNGVYPGVTNYDCTCFGQKLREYRIKTGRTSHAIADCWFRLAEPSCLAANALSVVLA